ncbi:hypothetical protein [Chengkuizengella axinellae]|uniref:Uncharacterized protein n=1 Tax=Chengkuizengella axinellae TaxID=3064388 RepID=A0ABT9J4P4_9BACL|nr:hypothetical protein [Chengkuizengella sp. 2205SS18-9]MDP5276576.1 hypothetical protein [Chengkuizengella sp. 2205SS18-9]
MNEDRWVSYLILFIILYTLAMIYLIEEMNPFFALQINFSIIIVLLIIILRKITKK